MLTERSVDLAIGVAMLLGIPLGLVAWVRSYWRKGGGTWEPYR